MPYYSPLLVEDPVIRFILNPSLRWQVNTFTRGYISRGHKGGRVSGRLYDPAIKYYGTDVRMDRLSMKPLEISNNFCTVHSNNF
ncbi:hypothetical protein J6590_105132 [Homalodisca vitripennis]|nr:hypothetical protein J6590_105132 [Homalodisca vitripennis]